jgi:hypothetical protein
MKSITNATTFARAHQIFAAALGTYDAAIGQLAALTAPGALAAPWRIYLSAGRRERAVLGALTAALAAGNSRLFLSDVRRAQGFSRTADAAIAGRGFNHCGRGR